MHPLLTRSMADRGECFGIAIACCATVLAGCGSGTEPAAGPNATASTAPPEAQVQEVPAEDWPAYNRTLAGDRFSPLSEINRGNVAQLRIVCTYTLPEVTAWSSSATPAATRQA
jgi:glucose dehydrogenase